MSGFAPTLRSHAAFAWAYHRASSRWPFNMLSPDADEIPEPAKEYLELTYETLPVPGSLERTLTDIIRGRHSCRDFSSVPLQKQQLSAILQNAAGVQGTVMFGNLELLRRPCPSPGALYPLEIYVMVRRVEAMDAGIYHYHAGSHSLGRLDCQMPSAAATTFLFMEQPYAADAAVVVVIACAFGRCVKKYRDRGYRYALLEAGHTGQNVILCSAALGLGSCPLGGFFDSALGGALMLDPEEESPVYAIAVGGFADQGQGAKTAGSAMQVDSKPRATTDHALRR
jgi:SagB-type dehydrogenase family enzyme